MANPSLQIGNNKWGIKEDNLLGYNTVGTNFLPIETTMTRASAGTRVNSSGLVETVKLLGSEEITNGDFATDSDWTLGGLATISGGNANFIDGGSNTYSYIRQNISQTSTKQYLLQFEIKNYVSGAIQVLLQGVSSTGTYNSNGVYSVVLLSGTTNGYIEISRSYSGGTYSFSIDNVSVKEYTANNLARVDYDGTVSSLLVEPQRTNTIIYSSDFSEWTIDGNSSITPNAITSPDGTLNATKLIAGSSSGRQAIKLNNTSTGDLAVSIFAKKGEYSVIQLSDAVNGTAFINFDLLNGLVGSSSVMSGKIVSLGNDWYKCIATYNSASSIISLRLSIAESSTSARLVNFLGNGSDGLYIWGCQVEAGSYATSYIPTSGSTVTRVQDQYEKTGISSKINSEEGTLFVEMAALADDNSDRRITLTDGTLNNAVNIGFSRFTGNINGEIHSSGTQQTTGFGATGVTQTNNNKFAIRWGNSNYSFFTNGLKTNDLIIANSPTGLNVLKFSSGNNIFKMFAKVKQLKVFKTALTDTELATLTT